MASSGSSLDSNAPITSCIEKQKFVALSKTSKKTPLSGKSKSKSKSMFKNPSETASKPRSNPIGKRTRSATTGTPSPVSSRKSGLKKRGSDEIEEILDSEEEAPRSPVKIPCSEVTYGVPANGLAYNSKLDCTKSVSEFTSSKLAYNGDDEAQQSQGDSSSGRITCSGPMLIYSGSVSIRSDSSSTRSFAFPILQPEWHASPVKMAKPDRRRYRKHGGWKQALTCCRF